MATLYITSLSENAGKTMFCAGLGKNWLDNGKKVGYLKLLSSTEQSQPAADKDALFIQQILGLKEPIETISAIINTQQDVAGMVKKAYSQISQDKDIVIVEGLPLNISNSMIEALEAKVLIIHDYANPLSPALAEYQKVGERLCGVVLNKVPWGKFNRVQSQADAELQKANLNLLGTIPENRILMTLTIAELAQAVQGKILNNEDKSGELIENFMLGASTFDRGPAYYNRKTNKAVILWGERPGVRKAALAGYQVAALATSTKCIVLSANAAPAANVVEQAGTKQVPIISAPGDVPSLISSIENAMNRTRFNQEKKMPQLQGILNQNLNLKLLSQSLGLAG